MNDRDNTCDACGAEFDSFGDCLCDSVPCCAECDTPFSPEDSGYSTVCCAGCAAAYVLRTGGLDV